MPNFVLVVISIVDVGIGLTLNATDVVRSTLVVLSFFPDYFAKYDPYTDGVAKYVASDWFAVYPSLPRAEMCTSRTLTDPFTLENFGLVTQCVPFHPVTIRVDCFVITRFSLTGSQRIPKRGGRRP